VLFWGGGGFTCLGYFEDVFLIISFYFISKGFAIEISHHHSWT